ncbi:MAG: aminomethyl-transferring glycine dehydrogenase [Flavobacteriales bacterium]|nr:aminomethyl-transferring glycine dehydrogenase [Flavobacteriales bacterium]
MDFAKRHIGPSTDSEVEAMLKAIGEDSVDSLVEKTIPQAIRLKEDLELPEAMSEWEYLAHMKDLAEQNLLYRSYMGMGYYGTITPPTIVRNILENPGWYTAYTPYQAEIAQGRLEALLNFQTVVSDLTGLELANASLLDEGTAAAEAMLMFYNIRSREQVKHGVNKLFIDENVFPQTLAVMQTRAEAMGIEIVTGEYAESNLDEGFFGVFIQYPAGDGLVRDYSDFVEFCHSKEIKVVVASDLLSLTLLPSPGSWGADVVVGNSQRFGVPMGYGGPHAAFFATRSDFKRHIPGRIIGVSKDKHGKIAYRMALQTREQHIRRDKATSNICTAQALLAVMAGMYAVYHGPKGLRNIALQVHDLTRALSASLSMMGITTRNTRFFDTLRLDLHDLTDCERVRIAAQTASINFRYFEDESVGISLDETTREEDVQDIIELFAEVLVKPAEMMDAGPSPLNYREMDYLEHPIFNSMHSETLLMRYMKKLENRDISLVHSMIPLGSCTMKLNAAAELDPITWPQFANIHPFAPVDQAHGYGAIISDLSRDLARITGFAGVSMQPNSGAQGEYAGLMVIKAYHEDQGDHQRKVVLIPSSAHGTNPASAVMAGCKVVVVKCDKHGNIDLDDLKEKAEKHADELLGLMITYPSTHGVFEGHVTDVTQIIHDHGGLVYMDGANMNAQVGLTSPGNIGADVCHLNLHKTFAIPHGGGGPGMGPIGVVEKLLPYLPSNPVIPTGGDKAIPAISSAPWGSSLILLISYGYIRMLGPDGLKRSTEMAILNANYLRAQLEDDYDILYKGEKGTVAHEMILDCRSFKQAAGISVEDIAKRLMDYGFHAPTVSFPVAGTLMVEPTESESKEELDRFIQAMKAIREEIAAIERGDLDKENNMLINAPHTADELIHGEWNRPYTKELAYYPMPYIKEQKYWPPVNRIDSAYGDRNLICSCPSIESYDQEQEAELVAD